MAKKACSFAGKLVCVFFFSVLSTIAFQLLVSYVSYEKIVTAFCNYAVTQIGAPTNSCLFFEAQFAKEKEKSIQIQISKDANANFLNQLIFYLWPATVTPANAILLFGTSVQVYNGDFFPHLVNFSSDSVPVDAVTPFAPGDPNCTSVSYSGYGCILFPSRLVFLRSSSLGNYSFSSIRLNATSSSTPVAIATAYYVLVDRVVS